MVTCFGFEHDLTCSTVRDPVNDLENTMSLWNTRTKDIPRNIVMRKRPVATVRPRPVRNALTMPGDELLCTHTGYTNGLFNHATQHNFAERTEAIQRKIISKMRKLECDTAPQLYRGELHQMPLRSLLENNALEFAYLDLCSALNPRVSRWIYTELAPSLAEGATVAVTLQRNWRRSPYMKWWCNSVKRRYSEPARLFQLADDMIRESQCTGVVGDLLTFYDDSLSSAAESFTLPAREPTKWTRLLCPEYHDASVDALSALMVLFPRHTFRLDSCIEYRRVPVASASMTTLVLTDFRRVAESQVATSLLRQLGDNVTPKMRMAAF